MSKVIELGCITKLEIPCEKLLKKAIDSNLTTVLILGYNKDGSLYFASSHADGGDIMWLMEKAKKELLEITDNE